MKTAILIKWHRTAGDIAHRGEPIFVIETAEATVDVPFPGNGVLRHLANIGDVIRPGTNLARIDPYSRTPFGPA